MQHAELHFYTLSSNFVFKELVNQHYAARLLDHNIMKRIRTCISLVEVSNVNVTMPSRHSRAYARLRLACLPCRPRWCKHLRGAQLPPRRHLLIGRLPRRLRGRSARGVSRARFWLRVFRVCYMHAASRSESVIIVSTPLSRVVQQVSWTLLLEE